MIRRENSSHRVGQSVHPKPYGMELILDLHGCELTDISKRKLQGFFKEVCQLSGMKRHGEPMWWLDRRGIPHLHGTSAVQFITTSNIVCHLLPLLNAVYINIFTCKPLRPGSLARFAQKYWGAKSIATQRVVTRK